MASKPTGKRQLTSTIAQQQDKRQALRDRDEYWYKMQRAEAWVRLYAPKGSTVQSVNQVGFYYRKPGQAKSEFTEWMSI